jgi:hypothetical protein
MMLLAAYTSVTAVKCRKVGDRRGIALEGDEVIVHDALWLLSCAAPSVAAASSMEKSSGVKRLTPGTRRASFRPGDAQRCSHAAGIGSEEYRCWYLCGAYSSRAPTCLGTPRSKTAAPALKA